MDTLLLSTLPVLHAMGQAFTEPSRRRFLFLLAAAVMATGRRTISSLYRITHPDARGDRSSWSRFLSSARWSSLTLACIFFRHLLRALPEDEPILLVGDDTVTQHKGKHVHAKGRHRDAVRSSRGYTAWHYGHKWVVLAVLIRFPLTRRAWALPVLIALYRTREENERLGKKHQTPAGQMGVLLRLVLRWFPERRFVFVGDGGYSSHALARLARRPRRQLTLVSLFHADANLYEPPPAYSGKGRPRRKGDKLPSPQEVIATAKRRRMKVRWYGDGQRRVRVVSGTGQWYKSGQDLVELRWVYVEDAQGTHRPQYFYSTDATVEAKWIIEIYTARWNVETTFQECRSYLGLGTTKGWCARTVRRAEPCLLGLYGIVALLYQRLPESMRQEYWIVWTGKESRTFSDAISAVRQWLWQQGVFEPLQKDDPLQKLPSDINEMLLTALAPVA